jgi:putative MATE family efflux protein
MFTDARSRLLAEEPIPRLLAKFSGPAIVGMLVMAIYNIVDTIFVGRIGTEAIAAIAIAFPIFMLIGTIGLAMGIGAGSYISRLLGEKNIEQANHTASTALLTTVGLALLFILSGSIFLQQMLRAFGATDTVLPYGIEYSGVLVAGSIFTMSNMCMNNMLRAEGSVKMSMIGLSTGAILNIILDPIFIFTLGMGIKGAAVATVLAQLVSTSLLLGYYLSGKSMLRIHLRLFRFSRKIYSEIIKIGFPTFVRQALVSASIGLMNNIAGNYGDPAIAAIGIILRVFPLGLMVLFGFAQGFQPIAGFSYGAKRYDRLLESIKVSLKWSSIFCVILTILFMVFTAPIIKVFSRDPEVIAIGVKGLRYFSIPLPVLGFTILMSTLFSALGRGFPSLILSFSRQGFFLMPCLIILPGVWGLNGLLFSQTAADISTALLTLFLSLKLIREIRTLQESEGLQHHR